jgi:hypothetical protein
MNVVNITIFEREVRLKRNLKKVESTFVVIIFARYDFLILEGPYRGKALHGLRFPIFIELRKK